MSSIFRKNRLGDTNPHPVSVFKEVFLDEEQKQAVTADFNRIVVVAGAGSGKTRVLTERIKHLLESGVQPSNIVAITFTNLAAEEMKERLEDVKGISDSFIGTIHSFANKIMKSSGEKYLLYTDDVDFSFHLELIKRYCQNLTYERYVEYKDLQAQVMLGKEKESALMGFFSPSEEADLYLLHLSQEDVKNNLGFPQSIDTLCRERKVIDFDVLLEKANAHYATTNSRVEHLLVDEFQDVGPNEFRFVVSLDPDNLFVVGDDKQAIYGFKGSNVRIFQSLVQSTDFQPFYLSNNYRNGNTIQQFAEVIINQVRSKLENPPMINRTYKDGSVVIRKKKDIASVLMGIADYRNQFILTRTNQELFRIAGMCEELSIPYVTFKREGMSLFELKNLMDKNRVKILTVHVSKGLEADNVILYGNFPVISPTYRVNQEERRVMYVGITRAKHCLTLLN